MNKDKPKEPSFTESQVIKLENNLWKKCKDLLSEPGLSRKAIFITGIRLGISLKEQEK